MEYLGKLNHKIHLNSFRTTYLSVCVHIPINTMLTHENQHTIYTQGPWHRSPVQKEEDQES